MENFLFLLFSKRCKPVKVFKISVLEFFPSTVNLGVSPISSKLFKFQILWKFFLEILVPFTAFLHNFQDYRSMDCVPPLPLPVPIPTSFIVATVFQYGKVMRMDMFTVGTAFS